MTKKDQSTIESRMAALDEGRLSDAKEAAIEPDLPIVDPHHHLWDFRSHRYLLDELLSDLDSGHRIEKTVYMECAAFYRQSGDPHMRFLGEVEFVNGVAAMAASGRYGQTLVAAGIVGMADLTLGAAVEDVLTAQLACSGERFKGIRYAAAREDKTNEIHNSHTNPPEHLYLDHPAFREGFAKLGQLNLSFDAWVYHPQLGELIDLATAFPDQPIVLNHVGGPLGLGYYASRKAQVFEQWSAQIQQLARRENVCIKLGGLGMLLNGFGFENRTAAPSSTELADAWKPFIHTAIEAFGAHRCMFESNFPVDKISGSYGNYWNAFKRLAADASNDEKFLLFKGTAERFYRL